MEQLTIHSNPFSGFADSQDLSLSSRAAFNSSSILLKQTLNQQSAISNSQSSINNPKSKILNTSYSFLLRFFSNNE